MSRQHFKNLARILKEEGIGNAVKYDLKETVKDIKGYKYSTATFGYGVVWAGSACYLAKYNLNREIIPVMFGLGSACILFSPLLRWEEFKIKNNSDSLLKEEAI